MKRKRRKENGIGEMEEERNKRMVDKIKENDGEAEKEKSERMKDNGTKDLKKGRRRERETWRRE